MRWEAIAKNDSGIRPASIPGTRLSQGISIAKHPLVDWHYFGDASFRLTFSADFPLMFSLRKVKSCRLHSSGHDNRATVLQWMRPEQPRPEAVDGIPRTHIRKRSPTLIDTIDKKANMTPGAPVSRAGPAKGLDIFAHWSRISVSQPWI
jgi:hypothetical protein